MNCRVPFAPGLEPFFYERNKTDIPETETGEADPVGNCSSNAFCQAIEQGGTQKKAA